MSGYLYLSTFRVAAEAELTFDTWFLSRHIPDLIGLGFLGVREYREAHGQGRVCNLYRVPGPDVFGDRYRQVAVADQLRTQLADSLYDVRTGLYDTKWAEQLFAAPPHVSLVAFTAPASFLPDNKERAGSAVKEMVSNNDSYLSLLLCRGTQEGAEDTWFVEVGWRALSDATDCVETITQALAGHGAPVDWYAAMSLWTVAPTVRVPRYPPPKEAS